MHLAAASIDPYSWSATAPLAADYGGAHVVADISAFTDAGFLST
jgi:hypothetical protein